MHVWHATIICHPNSPYKRGLFSIRIHFPMDYPLNPPTVHFTTRIFHPNINQGSISYPMLRESWNPIMRISMILEKLIEIFQDQILEAAHPDSNAIANMYNNDYPQYWSIARSWTLQYAIYFFSFN
ncbi:hypothetical protein REPUB_Repub09cG0087600 [Reevesia pubescens]